MSFDPLTAVLEIGGKLLDKFIPDPAKKAKAQLEMIKMQQAGEFKVLDLIAQSDTNQVNINLEEAKSDNLFKSGWRPYIGWVCGAGFSYQVLIQPVLTGLLPQYHFATIDTQSMLTLLLGLLGLGGMRSYEKLKGVN